VAREDGTHRISDVEDRNDPILRDVWPFCSDPIFIRKELRTSRSKDDPVSYIEKRIKEEEGSRKGDLRILLNRMMKRSGRKVTA
jgi:hypothetical protein